ncbi:MAG: SH3 domain-containing protein [Bacteroidota bacterium]
MKLLATFFLLQFLLFQGILYAQDIQYVMAESGLNMRNSAGTSGEKIGKLALGTEVEVVAYTGTSFTISDNGKEIKGEWVEVKARNGALANKSGFVFNGFLGEISPPVPMEILVTGTFHGEDVPSNSASREWLGLFEGEEGFYVSYIEPKLERVRDDMIDGEGEKTGWEVSTSREDKCILLVAGMAVNEGKVDYYPVEDKSPLPGSSIFIEGPKVPTSLYVTGTVELVDYGLLMKDYALTLRSGKGAEDYTQSFLHIEHLEETRVEIIWSGDIDRDGKLDLLINISHHYNLYQPTLYLSSRAEKGKLLRRMASFRATGC